MPDFQPCANDALVLRQGFRSEVDNPTALCRDRNCGLSAIFWTWIWDRCYALHCRDWLRFVDLTPTYCCSLASVIPDRQEQGGVGKSHLFGFVLPKPEIHIKYYSTPSSDFQHRPSRSMEISLFSDHRKQSTLAPRKRASLVPLDLLQRLAERRTSPKEKTVLKRAAFSFRILCSSSSASAS
jgi:hypothetical protein